eukprot:2044693-Amphidinium_carterae.1
MEEWIKSVTVIILNDVQASQTLNYVLLHATKQSSEAHPIIRRLMRQSNGSESWRQLQLQFAEGHRAQQFSLLRAIMQPSWTSETGQWISNYFNSTYTGTEGDNRGQVGGVSSYDNENYDNEEYNEYVESWDYVTMTTTIP